MSGIVTGCRLWLKVRLMLHGKLLLTRTPQHLWGICNLLWQQSSRAPSASSAALIFPMALGSSMRASLPCAADAHASAPICRGTFLRPLSALGPCAVLASSTMLFLPPGPFKRPFRVCVSAMPSERSPDSLNVCSSYRAIMLLPTLTKAIHRSLRPRLYEHVISDSPPLLLGGRRGASAVFGSHVTRAFHQWWCARKQPACTLFADVASANYNSVRDLTARRLDHDGRPVDARRGAPTGVTESVECTLADGSALQTSGATPWLESLAAEMHRGSWFLLRGDSVPVITYRGSRPGSSLADIMYSAGQQVQEVSHAFRGMGDGIYRLLVRLLSGRS